MKLKDCIFNSCVLAHEFVMILQISDNDNVFNNTIFHFIGYMYKNTVTDPWLLSYPLFQIIT